MTHLEINLNLSEQPWTDLVGADMYPPLELERIGLLPGGMSSGLPSIGMIARRPDGTPVLVEASWNQLYLAVQAIAASPVGSEGLIR